MVTFWGTEFRISKYECVGGEHNLVCSRIMYSLIFFFFTFKSRGVESRNRRIYREQTFDTAEGEMVGLIERVTLKQDYHM